MITVSTSETATAPQFSRAWRTSDGHPAAAVHIGSSSLIVASPDDALELAAALVTAANAITALPAPEGDPQ